jgi:RES domain-containing protein
MFARPLHAQHAFASFERMHRDTDALRRRLRNCLDRATSWEGTVYRATMMEFANRHDLLTGVGSRRFGGRWNPPGRFPAVYGCMEPEAAMAEPLANYRDYGIPASQAMPLVFVAVMVKATAVLDLTSADVMRRVGVSRRRMISVDWRDAQEHGEEALAQGTGRIAWEENLAGLVVPAARRRGDKNLVLFPDRRRRGSTWRSQGCAICLHGRRD